MVTIHDVAKRASVSITTVSKVLSNTSYVSAETRDRVVQAMHELDYVPSLAARTLRARRTHLLGLVVPYDPDFLFNDPFLLEVIRGVETVTNENDYNLVFSLARKGDQNSAYRRLTNTRYLDGVITLETFAGDQAAVQIGQLNLTRVSVGYRNGTRPVNSVHADDFSGGYLATKHLLQRGHTRIGVVAGPPNFMQALEERWRGVKLAFAEVGIEIHPALTTYGDFTPESGYAAAHELLARPTSERPTAIFAFNDRMALGILRAARELRLNIPDNLALVGFDDIPMAALVEPSLTTVRQPGYEMGKVAAQRLLELMTAGESTEFEPVVLPVEFVVRSST